MRGFSYLEHKQWVAGQQDRGAGSAGQGAVNAGVDEEESRPPKDQCEVGGWRGVLRRGRYKKTRVSNGQISFFYFDLA